MNRYLLSTALFAIIFLAACSTQTVQRGDYVQLTYAGTYQNGTMFDTNDPTLSSSFPAPPDRFKPLTVHTGAGQVVPGFENAIIGMKLGEKKTVNIKPRDAYGTYDAEKTVSVPRELTFVKEVNVQRVIVTPKAEFQQKMQKNVTIGQTFETLNFIYNVTAANVTDVTLYLLNATKDPVQLEGTMWNSTLKRKSDATLVYSHNVLDGANIVTQSGPYIATVNATHIVLKTLFTQGQQFQTAQGMMRVTTVSDDSVTLDFNHPLAGQELTFNITIDTIGQK